MSSDPTTAQLAPDADAPASAADAPTPPTQPADPAPPAGRAPLLIALAVAVGSTLVYGFYSTLQWHHLTTPSWDLGIFSELAKAYSRLEAPIVDIKGDGFNLLGDHFHPILVLLGPLWALWPSGLALLWLQAALFGLSAFPLTRLAVERLGRGAGLTLGVAYVFAWGLQSAQLAQFHEIAFGVPIMAFALTAYLRGRLTAAALWAGALVFVKEDLGITAAMLGVIIVWKHRDRWRTGAALAVWGVAWVALATLVILPALNPADQYDYGDRLASIWSVFVPISKWITVGMLVLTAGVVGLRSPLILLMLPTLAWRFMGSVAFYWSWGWHYSAILMPIAAAALLGAIPRRRVFRWAALAACAAGTLLLGQQLPLSHMADPEFYGTSWRWESAQDAVAAVPEGASVESDLGLMNYLVPRADVYWVGNDNPAPDAVAVDEYSHIWDDQHLGDAATWATDRYGMPYTLVYDHAGYQVAVRSEG